MTVSEEFETNDNKREKNKAQYCLDRQTAKILALSLGNVSKQACQEEKGRCVVTTRLLLSKASGYYR